MNAVMIFTTRSGSMYTLDTLDDGTEILTVKRQASHTLDQFETYEISGRTEIILGASAQIIEAGTDKFITTSAIATITMVLPPLGRSFTDAQECARHRLGEHRATALPEFIKEVGRQIDAQNHQDAYNGRFLPARKALI